MRLASVRWKIISWSALCMIVIITAVSGYLLNALREQSLNTAIETIKAQSLTEVSVVREHFDKGLNTARTISNVLDGLRETKKDDVREQAIALMRSVLDKQTELLGLWTVWEPNAYDGKDADWVGKAGHDKTGRFVAYWNRVGGLHVEPCNSYEDDNKDSGWYVDPRNSGKSLVIQPYVYDIGGKQTMVVSLAAPVDSQRSGKALGVAGADIDVNFLQGLVDNVKVLGVTPELALVSDTGVIAAVTGMPKLAGKQVDDYFKNESEGKAFKNARSSMDIAIEFHGDKLYLAMPIRFTGSPTMWTLLINVPQAAVYSKAMVTVWRAVGIVIGCLIVVLIAIYFLSGFISKPIEKTAHAIDRVASGDLNVVLVPYGKDEIATMQTALNDMVAKLKSNITEIEDQCRLAEERTGIAEKAQQQAQDALQQAAEARRQGLAYAASQLDEVTGIVASATSELSSQIDESSRGAEVQAERVGQTATAMEQMAASVLEIAKNAETTARQAEDSRKAAQKGAELVAEVKNDVDTIHTHFSGVYDAVSDLSRKADAIGSIAQTIDDIADQTNLLALNAAIEAARAGEAGRGFAVVADEVRKLAEKTMLATKEVSQSVQAIQKGVDDTLGGMDLAKQSIDKSRDEAIEAEESIRAIVRSSEQSADQVRAIATAAEEQSSTTEEINRSIDEINIISSETAQAMNEAARAIAELNDQTEVMHELVNQLKEEANEGSQPRALAV